MGTKHEIDGVLPIFKPKGMTSHDVVHRLRKILKIKRIGHTGTLDPEVTGVLPICIGKATRIAEYIMDLPKSYQGRVTLGIATTTEDATGEVIEETEVEFIPEEQIKDVLQTFIGEIEQVPPMYSSIKIHGQRLYQLARQGKTVEREPRKVRIYNLEMIDYHPTKHPKIDFTVTCSKGTYIRTLCVDIGKKLGYPAHMSYLIRTKSGPFHLEQTYTLEEIEQIADTEKLKQAIIPLSESLPHLPKVILPKEEIDKKVFNGQKIVLQLSKTYEGLVRICDSKGNLAALYIKNKNEEIAKPKKVFKDN
ncbi:tRNA pseudouridine(55) synthase TruB [Tepidibacillus sp. LV47]|uniref:tRNA pseudouridine(55) synthase TruB n=1 Tax=Tepidibacillus sp. LV47 TaxID=3398228 RepID=UPI003AAF12E4